SQYFAGSKTPPQLYNSSMRRFPHSALAAFLVLALVLSTVTPALAAVHKIGNDLYAYISENDASANSTFLVTPEGILVVDTGLNEREGRKLLAEIRKISPAPVRYIINTHYHPDHVGGNNIVGPGAIIISNEYPPSQQRAFTYSVDGTKISFPTRAGFQLGGHEIKVLFPGPAHTLHDALVYFPEEHAIATGDLFLNGSCPAMDEGDMENWIDALDEMLKMPVETFVPGHFEVGNKEQLRHFRDYLAALRDQVAQLFRSGASLEQMQKKLDMSMYKDLRQYPQYEATFTDNAAAYYHQLQQRK
ncbi:MAG TPA: MBL fold metallo-hydrolase, partial [Candidatus Angelobacter sp.]